MAINKEAYLCLSAMLRAREPKLLNVEKAERMLDAGSFEEAAKLLTDCGYPDMTQMTAGEIEAALAEERAAIFSDMASLAPDTAIVDCFRMKYDYHNAKAILKAEVMGVPAEGILSSSGRISGEKLTEYYNEDKMNLLPPALAQAMTEGKQVLARTSNPQLADFVLDKAYFEELSNAAEEMDDPFFRGYVGLLIDSTNLKSVVRTLRMGKGEGFLSEVLIPGGTVSTSRIEGAADKDGIAALFAHTPLEKAGVLGGEAVDGGSLTAFELACDNAVNAYLRDAKYASYGPEALIAYLAAKESEITAVRMILTGRLAGIAPQVIRERLREQYA